MVAAAFAAAAIGAAPASAAATCNQVATPGPGAAQRLVDSLAPGETGCLRGGLYEGNVKVSQPGVTLTRYGAEKAIVKGRFWVAEGADGVTVQGLYLDGTNAEILPSPTINAADVSFRRNDVTNNHTAICFSLGHQDWGRAVRTKIEFNRIHDCGRLPATNHDHGIYINASTGALIRGNWIYDNADRGIQLFPDAQDTTITGNVIDGNGQGIIFSGEGGVASNGNLVVGNVIANSRLRNNVESWYPQGNPIGHNNVVRDNCVKGGAYDDGDGGIGDQLGFRVVSSVRAKPGFANRGAKDYRLSSTSACRVQLGFRNSVPGPEGLRNARATRAPRRVVLAAARRQVRRGGHLRLLGGVVSGKSHSGQRVTILARSRGHWRRIGASRLDAKGSFSLRPRVRASRSARFLRVRAVVHGVGHSRSLRVRLRRR
jgi:nitrous oxidase accessory protein NosD